MHRYSLPTEFRDGVVATVPLLVGVAPFALVAGVAAVNAGLSVPAAMGMSVVVFAGASQLAIIELLGENAPLAVVVFTAIVVNLRILMYSASIAPYFRGHDTRWKALLAYFLTDQAYAVSVTRYEDDARDGDADDAEAAVDAGDDDSSPPDDGVASVLAGVSMTLAERRWYFLGSGISLWVVWVVGTAVGVTLGRGVPSAWGLEFAVPLVFLALLVPRLKDRSTTAAGAVAAAVAVLAAGAPFHLGLPAAAVAGVGVGLALDGRGRRA